MSFAEFAPPRGATIPEHNRLRGLDNGNPHPQYAHRTHLDVRAVANSVVGGTPPTEGIWAQAGTVVVTTDAAGLATVTFPKTFTGVVTVTISNGDSSPSGAIVNSRDYTLTGFGITVLKHDGAAHVGLFRLNWLAVGW